MKDKSKLIPSIVTILAFGITKYLVGTNFDPIKNILIAALVGGIFGGGIAAMQSLLRKEEMAPLKLIKLPILVGAVLAIIGIVSMLLLSNAISKQRKVTFAFPHCVLTHSFASQLAMGNNAFWKKDDSGFKINCEATGRKGCEWGLKEQEICNGYDEFSELRCVKHPDDASHSTDFTAMWPIVDEKPGLQVVPISDKNVHANCRKLDNSCDASFNVYAANNNNDVEYVQCSGTYREE